MSVERHVEVINELGIHVRPSSAIAETAGRYSSRVEVIKDGQAVNAKSSIELLTLAAVQGTPLTIVAEGPDAADAINAVADLIASGFSE